MGANVDQLVAGDAGRGRGVGVVRGGGGCGEAGGEGALGRM